MKLFTTLAALVLTSSVAFAADLPSNKVPFPPVRPAESAPLFGVSVLGGTVFPNAVVQGNADVYLIPHAYGELSYTYTFNNRQDAFVNVLPSYDIGNFTTYAIGGIGADIRDSKAYAGFNAGAGVKYHVTQNAFVDVRYQYVNDFAGNAEQNRLLGGVGFSF